MVNNRALAFNWGGVVYGPYNLRMIQPEKLLHHDRFDCNLSMLDEARNLLYRCYIEKMGWEIKPDNFSSIRINEVRGKLQLVDDYDDVSIWFSLTQDNEAVACARLCPEDANHRLEMERYPDAKKVLGSDLLQLKQKFRVLELNREAVFPHVVDDRVFVLLLKMIFEYCLDHQYAIVTATSIKKWMTLYDHILFPRLKNHQFKYADTDPEAAAVYFAKDSDIKKMNSNLNRILKEKNEERIC